MRSVAGGLLMVLLAAACDDSGGASERPPAVRRAHDGGVGDARTSSTPDGAFPDGDAPPDGSLPDGGAPPDGATIPDGSGPPDATLADLGPAPDGVAPPLDAAPLDAAALRDASRPARDATPAPAPPDPRLRGPHELRETPGELVERDGRRIPMTAYLPVRPDARPAPLIVLLPGFQLESARYTPLAEHLATHGLVVVRADPPAGLFDADHVAMAEDTRAVIDRALSGPLAPAIDPDRIGLIGHSLGGKVSVMTAHRDLRVGAVFALDPVNGGHPVEGYSAARPDIVPAEVERLAIPLGFLGETTNTEGFLGGPPCAPADQNFLTFFEAATASPWVAAWEIAGADHMDFVFDTTDCLVCGVCLPGEADEAAIRAATVTLATAFFLRHFEGHEVLDGVLTGPDLPPGVQVRRPP